VSYEESVVAVDDGTRLWTATTGSGAALVLCHGGPGLADYLAPLAAMVGDLATVHRWDQRGSGRSSATGPYTLSRFVGDLEALRQHFGYEKWIVCGHSWGASLALLYALAHPGRTRALIYLSGTGLAWTKWKRAYHEEHESRLSSEDRARFRFLKSKRRTTEEEWEYRVLEDMPNFADRQRARELAETDVREILEYPINYEASAKLSAEVETLEEERLVARCRGLQIPTLVVMVRWIPALLRRSSHWSAHYPNASELCCRALDTCCGWRTRTFLK
jgi:proline iminopeptidase